MKDKKGFTLVELLAVTVVLTIILSITTISVTNLKKKQDEENIKNTISSILTAAKQANVDNRNKTWFTVNDLKNDGYVNFDENTKYNGKTYKELLINDGIDDIYVKKVSCTDPDAKMKVKYVFDKAIDTLEKYNDCGCQLNNETPGKASDKLCVEP